MSEVLEYRESDESVLVPWLLPDLPTAQHKAGLAGLFVYVSKMPEFIQNAPIPVIESWSPLELSIRFTQASLTTLMDSVYAGEEHLVESRTKWNRIKPDGEKTVTVKENDHQKKAKVFLYKRVRPKAELITYWMGGDSENSWVVLWREAVRGVLRAGGNTEKIYEFTPKQESPTEKSGDLKKLWSGLVTAGNRREAIQPVPTSIFIGAETKSAERVDFKGEVHHNLLLHFWPFVSPVFVPKALQREKGQWKRKDRGFVMAVPEVSNLKEFASVIDAHWRRVQDTDDGDSGYRPQQSWIETAVEGGMAFLHSLAIDKLDNMDDGDFFDAVPQVELYHLEKLGNSVRMLAAESVRLPAGTLKKFDWVRSRPRLNALLKRLILGNLLDGLPWYARAAETLFTRFPVELFIRSAKSPGFAQNFGLSAREQFRNERNEMSDQINIASKVYDMVGEFVAQRAEKRSGFKRDELPKKSGKIDWSNPSEKTNRYLEAREKVATDAFLAIRGRNSDEFVDYFIGSICAVPQFMGAKGVSPEQGFIAVSDALHESEDKRTEMKNLAMLALCAHAWRQRSQTEESNNNPQPE